MKRRTSIVIAAVALSLAACAAGTRVIVFIDLASFLAPTDAASLQSPLPSIPTSFDVYFLPGYQIVESGEEPSEALRAGYPVVFPVPKHADTGARVGLRIAGSISVTPAPLTNTEIEIEAAIGPAGSEDVYDLDDDAHVLNIASSESKEAFTVEFDVDWQTGTGSLVDEILSSGEFRLGVRLRVQIEELSGFEPPDPGELELRYDIEFLFVEITAYPIDFLP